MKNYMYLIYCEDTYITCFIDSKDFKYEVIQDGSDVVVSMLDIFYVHFCNCHFTVKEA